MAMSKKKFMSLSDKEMNKIKNDELMELLIKFKIINPKDFDSTKMRRGGMIKKMKMALGGVTGMSGGMNENKKNSATGMTTMRYGGAVAGKKSRTGHMDMRKNGMMYGGMVKKKKG